MAVLKKEWTDARKNAFIKGGLRAASRRWPPRFERLAEAKTDKRINVKTGRMAQHFRCSTCLGEFPAKDVQVDHIEAIIDPAIGFVDWDTVIERMFCEKDNLQVLCSVCHKAKTATEREMAKQRKNKINEL